MVGGRGRRLVLTAAVVSALVGAGTAQAGGGTVRDENDRPGPLDIRSASQGHAGTKVTHTIRTFANWRIGLLGPSTPNLFAVEISTDSDRALEWVVLAFSANGRMIARVFKLPSGTFVGSASASKPDGHTVRVTIPRSRFGNPPGYRWIAHSQYRAPGPCSRRCVDHAPSSGSVLHDLRAPTVSFPQPAVPPDVAYNLNFSVADAGGSGVRWRLQRRAFGTVAWATIRSGTGGGGKTASFNSAQGQDDQFRVLAIDGHGNRTTSPVRLVSVPVDDTSAAFTYSGTWTPGGSPADFLSTLSLSTEMNATASYTFAGRFVALVAPGGTGTASVTIDAMPQGSIDLSTVSGSRRIVFQQTFGSDGPRTLVVTVTGGTMAIDGIIDR